MLHFILISDKPREWDRKLPSILWSLRSMVNDTTGLSPYELVFGKPGRGVLEVLTKTWKGVEVIDT